MKKKIVCLMIACLSLFAFPYQLSAVSLAETTETSIPSVIDPPLEKKIKALKKKHPELFSKTENKEAVTGTSEETQSSMGIIVFVLRTVLVAAIVLAVIFIFF